ncbi:hypothetical protein HK101_005816 [Irineochytrium annulatum]|nr:hypothetical protein HK101_005816 [Irineochytrium annulatum]
MTTTTAPRPLPIVDTNSSPAPAMCSPAPKDDVPALSCLFNTSLRLAANPSPSQHSRPKRTREPPAILLPPEIHRLTFPQRHLTRIPDGEAGSDPVHRERACRDRSTTIEVSVHNPGRHLRRELAMVFSHLAESQREWDCEAAVVGGARAAGEEAGKRQRVSGPDGCEGEDVTGSAEGQHRERGIKDVLVIPTFQQSSHDLVAVTPDTNWERNLLLEYFFSWGKRMCYHLRKMGHWADLTDPASGYPMDTDRGVSLYPDVDGAAVLLKYATVQAGCCRVIAHPRWGTKCYPATLFTTAPFDDVKAALRDVAFELGGGGGEEGKSEEGSSFEESEESEESDGSI